MNADTWAALKSELVLDSDDGRYVRYSMGSCPVEAAGLGNDYAFDWDANEKVWEVLTTDALYNGISNEWFYFSTVPVTNAY